MAFIDEFKDMMPHEVTIHKKGTYTKAGDVIPGPDLNVQCYVQGKAVKMVGADGTDVVSSHVVYAYTYLGDLEPEATVTLPAGFHPRYRLHIIAIDPLSDEEGPNAGSVLYLKG